MNIINMESKSFNYKSPVIIFLQRNETTVIFFEEIIQNYFIDNFKEVTKKEFN